MYNETITKYGVPVACTTEICTYRTCNIRHILMVCVCACVVWWLLLDSLRSAVCVRARAVVREFADGASSVRQVPRPPIEKFMHGMPARTLGADRSVSSIYEFVLCFTSITIMYKSIRKNETILYNGVCLNVVRTAYRVRGRRHAPCRMGPLYWVCQPVFLIRAAVKILIIHGRSAAAGMSGPVYVRGRVCVWFSRRAGGGPE